MSNAENGARRGVHLRRRPSEAVKKPHSRKLDHYTKRSKLFFVDLKDLALESTAHGDMRRGVRGSSIAF